MLEQGADPVDVGGESTPARACAVPPAAEIGAVVPVIRRAASCGDGSLSIDTTAVVSRPRRASRRGRRSPYLIRAGFGAFDPELPVAAAADARAAGADAPAWRLRDDASRAPLRRRRRRARAELETPRRTPPADRAQTARPLIGFLGAKPPASVQALVAWLSTRCTRCRLLLVGPSRKQPSAAGARPAPRGPLPALPRPGARSRRARDVAEMAQAARVADAILEARAVRTPTACSLCRPARRAGSTCSRRADRRLHHLRAAAAIWRHPRRADGAGRRMLVFFHWISQWLNLQTVNWTLRTFLPLPGAPASSSQRCWPTSAKMCRCFGAFSGERRTEVVDELVLAATRWPSRAPATGARKAIWPAPSRRGIELDAVVTMTRFDQHLQSRDPAPRRGLSSSDRRRRSFPAADRQPQLSRLGLPPPRRDHVTEDTDALVSVVVSEEISPVALARVFLAQLRTALLRRWSCPTSRPPHRVPAPTAEPGAACERTAIDNLALKGLSSARVAAGASPVGEKSSGDGMTVQPRDGELSCDLEPIGDQSTRLGGPAARLARHHPALSSGDVSRRSIDLAGGRRRALRAPDAGDDPCRPASPSSSDARHPDPRAGVAAEGRRCGRGCLGSPADGFEVGRLPRGRPPRIAGPRSRFARSNRCSPSGWVEGACGDVTEIVGASVPRTRCCAFDAPRAEVTARVRERYDTLRLGNPVPACAVRAGVARLAGRRRARRARPRSSQRVQPTRCGPTSPPAPGPTPVAVDLAGSAGVLRSRSCPPRVLHAPPAGSSIGGPLKTETAPTRRLPPGPTASAVPPTCTPSPPSWRCSFRPARRRSSPAAACAAPPRVLGSARTHGLPATIDRDCLRRVLDGRRVLFLWVRCHSRRRPPDDQHAGRRRDRDQRQPQPVRTTTDQDLRSVFALRRPTPPRPKSSG